jgi:hypothetical protein
MWNWSITQSFAYSTFLQDSFVNEIGLICEMIYKSSCIECCKGVLFLKRSFLFLLGNTKNRNLNCTVIGSVSKLNC